MVENPEMLLLGGDRLRKANKVLKDDPKPMSALAADVPRDLENLITRCLRKDPDRRFQHMGDVKVALQELKEESDSGKLTGIVQGGTPTQRKSRWTWTLAGTAVLLIAGVGVGFWFLRPRSHPAPKIIPLTSYPGRQITPAFSNP